MKVCLPMEFFPGLTGVLLLIFGLRSRKELGFRLFLFLRSVDVVTLLRRQRSLYQNIVVCNLGQDYASIELDTQNTNQEKPKLCRQKVYNTYPELQP
jgi:hypothetical protein